MSAERASTYRYGYGFRIFLDISKAYDTTNRWSEIIVTRAQGQLIDGNPLGWSEEMTAWFQRYITKFDIYGSNPYPKDRRGAPLTHEGQRIRHFDKEYQQIQTMGDNDW